MENKNESRQVITCDCKHSFAVDSEALDKKIKLDIRLLFLVSVQDVNLKFKEY